MLEKKSSCKRGGRSAFWRGKGALFLLVIFSILEENHVDLEKKNQQGRFRVIPEKDSTHSGGF